MIWDGVEVCDETLRRGPSERLHFPFLSFPFFPSRFFGRGHTWQDRVPCNSANYREGCHLRYEQRVDNVNCIHSIIDIAAAYSVFICMYVYMYGHTYSKSMDQPDKVANSARGQLNRENEYFPVPVRA